MDRRYHPNARHRKACIRRIVQRDGGAFCGPCGKPIKRMEEITLDHKEPRKLGGSEDITNLQLAHEGCNKIKGSMTPEEWQELQAGSKIALHA